MSLLFPLFVAGLPVFLLLAYFHHRDKGEKEPALLVRRIFIYGFFITLPVAFIEYYLSAFSLGGNNAVVLAFLTPFLLVALPEEAAKLLIVKKIAYNHKKFNEIMDGITYCVIASMGFALAENILYTLQFGASTGYLRAFTAVPAHALFSGIMGYTVGRAKFSKTKEQENKLFTKALLIGVFFHGLYDFLLMSGIPLLVILVLPLLAYMATQLNYAIRLANAQKAEELEYF